jgi:hypothetical protein
LEATLKKAISKVSKPFRPSHPIRYTILVCLFSVLLCTHHPTSMLISSFHDHKVFMLFLPCLCFVYHPTFLLSYLKR